MMVLHVAQNMCEVCYEGLEYQMDGCRSTQHLGLGLVAGAGWSGWSGGVPSTPGWGGAEMAAHTLLSPAGGLVGGTRVTLGVVGLTAVASPLSPSACR